MQTPEEMISIEVVFANAATYKIIALQVRSGTTIENAILQSGILCDFPEICPEYSVGIFGVVKGKETMVLEGDRVEIYRPLLQDPMQARKEKAKKAKADRLLHGQHARL